MDSPDFKAAWSGHYCSHCVREYYYRLLSIISVVALYGGTAIQFTKALYYRIIDNLRFRKNSSQRWDDVYFSMHTTEFCLRIKEFLESNNSFGMIIDGPELSFVFAEMQKTFEKCNICKDE